MLHYLQHVLFNDFAPKLFGSLIGTTVAASISLLLPDRGLSHVQRKNYWQVALLVAIMASGLMLALSKYKAELWINILLLAALVLDWTVFFHLVAREFGPKLSAGWFGPFIGKHWVRMIDYVYLAGSTIGIVRIALNPMLSIEGAANINAAGILFLAMALGLRLTKTSIEIFGWAERAKPKPRVPLPWAR